MQAVVRPMVTRLLLGSFRRPIPPALCCTSGLLHRSPEVRHLHVLPKTGSSRFGGSHSSSKAPRRIFGAVSRDVLVSSFFCSSAALFSGGKSDLGNTYWPPAGPHDHGSDEDKGQCTNALIAMNVLVHVADMATNRKLSRWGAKDNALIRRGQVWRLATPAVLHESIAHIAVNSLALANIGPMVEEATGPRKFLAIYCASALTGSLMSYFFSPHRGLGASGAICGLVGAQAVYTWRHKDIFENANEALASIGICALLNMGIGIYFRHRIDQWAHLGGLLGGVAVEWFVGPHWDQYVTKYGMVLYEDKAPIVQLMNSNK